ncbi:MAG: pyridoxal phosphate-dependent aminotransferase [Candidatus Bathyarchaeia archaeon]
MPRYSDVLDKVPKYPFARVSQLSREVQERDKIDVVNIRIGIPDREAPETIKRLVSKYVLAKNSTFGYPCDVHPERGIPELVEAIITHYRERHGVDLKPENIAVTSWTKEALHNIARLFGKGNGVVPVPVYPAYVAGILLSGHKPRTVPSFEETNWLPNMTFTKNDAFFYFCDPNNPTGAVADRGYYDNLLCEMVKHDVGGIFDKAYKDYVFDDNVKPVSITEFPEMLDYGFEVVSFSKHCNFVGIGLGWIVSSKQNIDRWLKLSSQYSQGVAWYVQKAGVEALTNPEVKNEIRAYMEEVKQRKDVFVQGLNKIGFKCKPPKATPYLFPRIPEVFGDDDERFALKVLLEKAHVAVMPGSYFGESGKGYVRATLFQPKSVIEEALRRIMEIRNW